MILQGYYVNNILYAQFDFRLYQLVFEHNYTKSNCFKDEIEAKNTSGNGKFSILYDLDSSKYVMNDGFRHFIIDYPTLNLLNSWKQKKSPLQDIEQKGVKTAEGFEADVNYTEIPSDTWGGLVKSKFCNDSFLDGIPGEGYWFYSVGMLCTAQDHFLKAGIPVYFDTSEHTTDKVRLWGAIKDYSIVEKCSCAHRLYFSMLYVSSIHVMINLKK